MQNVLSPERSRLESLTQGIMNLPGTAMLKWLQLGLGGLPF